MSGEEIRKDVNKRIKWWQASFEGANGKTSGNLLTIFAVVILDIITWYANLFGGREISNNLLYLLVTLNVLGIFASGFVTMEMVKSVSAAIAGQPYVTDNTNININNREQDDGHIDNVDA